MSSPGAPHVEALAGGKLRLDAPAPGVARLAIAHPAKRNALDHEILDALAKALEGLDARCVIITGSGGMFSAGYDIGDLPAGPGARGADEFAQRAEALVAHPFTRALEAVEAYPYPTLAALGGHAIGGGLELALSCDLRVAATGIRLGMPPALLGLVYSHTGLRKFIDVIGVARTRQLFFTGRNVDAETARDWGLVGELAAPAELDARALALATEVAGNAPLSLLGNKRVIAALLGAEGGLEAGVESELVALREACFTTEDFSEGVRAFAEKRPPRWQGR